MSRGRLCALALGTLTLVACDEGTGPPGLQCPGGPFRSIAVGEVVEPADLVGGTVCLASDEEVDYVVVVSVTTTGDAFEVDVLGTGFIAGSPDVVAGPPDDATAALSVRRRGSDIASGERGNAAPHVDVGSHPVALARFEADELATRIRRTGSPGAADPARLLAAAYPPAVPAPGDLVAYPTAVSCDADPALRQGRVVTVNDRSIVLIDPAAPAGGFSDAELASFATFFDETAYPTLSAAFGAPSDIDGNGRVIFFFTPAANALSPRSSATVVGGFFWSGDLFPTASVLGSRLGPCATSAEAEILYLSVPDPDGVFAAPISAEQLETHAVMGHEFQHLINASRRLHVNGADRLEEPWLNEGMSHIAEELLFYEASALSPRENIGEPQLAAPGLVDIFNRYAYGNVGRYNVFLQAPHVHSALGTDRIETRGAAWSYLRYVLDREPSNNVLRALADSRQAGLLALEGALGRDPLELMAEWSVSLVADDLGGDAADPRFRQASWDLKSIIAAIRSDGRYPLEVIGIPPDQGVRFSLRAGGAGFGALRTEPGRQAVVSVRPRADGVGVRAFLVRVR